MVLNFLKLGASVLFCAVMLSAAKASASDYFGFFEGLPDFSLNAADEFARREILPPGPSLPVDEPASENSGIQEVPLLPASAQSLSNGGDPIIPEIVAEKNRLQDIWERLIKPGASPRSEISVTSEDIIKLPIKIQPSFFSSVLVPFLSKLEHSYHFEHPLDPSKSVSVLCFDGNVVKGEVLDEQDEKWTVTSFLSYIQAEKWKSSAIIRRVGDWQFRTIRLITRTRKLCVGPRVILAVFNQEPCKTFLIYYGRRSSSASSSFPTSISSFPSPSPDVVFLQQRNSNHASPTGSSPASSSSSSSSSTSISSFPSPSPETVAVEQGDCDLAFLMVSSPSSSSSSSSSSTSSTSIVSTPPEVGDSSRGLPILLTPAELQPVWAELIKGDAKPRNSRIDREPRIAFPKVIQPASMKGKIVSDLKKISESCHYRGEIDGGASYDIYCFDGEVASKKALEKIPERGCWRYCQEIKDGKESGGLFWRCSANPQGDYRIWSRYQQGRTLVGPICILFVLKDKFDPRTFLIFFDKRESTSSATMSEQISETREPIMDNLLQLPYEKFLERLHTTAIERFEHFFSELRKDLGAEHSKWFRVRQAQSGVQELAPPIDTSLSEVVPFTPMSFLSLIGPSTEAREDREDGDEDGQDPKRQRT